MKYVKCQVPLFPWCHPRAQRRHQGGHVRRAGARDRAGGAIGAAAGAREPRPLLHREAGEGLPFSEVEEVLLTRLSPAGGPGPGVLRGGTGGHGAGRLPKGVQTQHFQFAHATYVQIDGIFTNRFQGVNDLVEQYRSSGRERILVKYHLFIYFGAKLANLRACSGGLPDLARALLLLPGPLRGPRAPPRELPQGHRVPVRPGRDSHVRSRQGRGGDLADGQKGGRGGHGHEGGVQEEPSRAQVDVPGVGQGGGEETGKKNCTSWEPFSSATFNFPPVYLSHFRRRSLTTSASPASS